MRTFEGIDVDNTLARLPTRFRLSILTQDLQELVVRLRIGVSSAEVGVNLLDGKFAVRAVGIHLAARTSTRVNFLPHGEASCSDSETTDRCRAVSPRIAEKEKLVQSGTKVRYRIPSLAFDRMMEFAKRCCVTSAIWPRP